jgi:hypothetical protein
MGGGDEIGQSDHQRDGESLPSRQLAQETERRQTRRDGDGERQPIEGVHCARSELREPNDKRVWPERIALGDQPLGLPARQAVDGEQVLGHVRVQTRPEDPEPGLDDERKRRCEQRQRRHRRSGPKIRGEVPDAGAQDDERDGAQNAERDQRGQALSRQAHRSPGDGDQRPEANGRRQPRPSSAPASHENRLTDEPREAEDEQKGRVRPEHRGRA